MEKYTSYILLSEDLCTGCGLCARECPLLAIEIKDNLPFFFDTCVGCALCVTICPVEALQVKSNENLHEKLTIQCDHCPVGCLIAPDHLGACKRYKNESGRIVNAQLLLLPEDTDLQEHYREALLNIPVITAVGAGSTYPDYIPAPVAAEKRIDDVDVVTVVTECPLTYSSMLFKIDTERFIGEETAPVKYRGAVVGHVTTEQYGSKMITVGGINVMKGKNRLKAVRLIVGAGNHEPVILKVEGGAELELTAGQPPIINGQPGEAMKISCGAAMMGIFGEKLKDLADEIIVLDGDITGLFSESHVGRGFGFTWSGIIPKGKYSTPGRYFGTPGEGWGGTDIHDPVKAFDLESAERIRSGMKLLVLEVTGTHAALLEADEKGNFYPIPLTSEVKGIRDLIAQNSQPALTSAMYFGGCGGSARAGITGNPVKLNNAVHSGSVKLTVGGVPAYVMPGGGINFIVDTGKMQWRSFSWTPTPAVVAPIEYTMEKKTYFEIGGHKRKLLLLDEIIRSRKIRKWENKK